MDTSLAQEPLTMDIAHQVGKNAGKDDEWGGMNTFSKDIVLGMLSGASDVAAGISFLAGHDSDYMTGQTLIIDAGMQFQWHVRNGVWQHLSIINYPKSHSVISMQRSGPLIFVI
ncbi:MAG: hypothetical protein LKJ47_01390 [Bifidobacteriaceae bacterium]|jgi:hypothetical protein|nr:hypothetical protein [Bifidobacteriaceae bacterium]